MSEAVTPDAPVELTLEVNGTGHTLRVDPRTTLLEVVRDHLQLTGAKQGCDRGQCGACTLIVNGRRVYSCLALAVAHDGERITTVEGLAGDALHPLQAAFVEHDAFQCGYCTSGQIVSAAAMIDEARGGAPSAVTPHLSTPIELTDDEIRERMSGNLCRCGAYPHIVDAVRAAAEKAR